MRYSHHTVIRLSEIESEEGIMWIWQQDKWPNFYWDERVIEPLLRSVRFNQGLLLGKMTSQDQEKTMLDTLLANIVHSSAIEGETLNAFSVRSSLANKLGVSEESPFPTTEQIGRAHV